MIIGFYEYVHSFLNISLWIDEICTYYQKCTDTYVLIYHDYLYIYILAFDLYYMIYIYRLYDIYIYIYALTGKTYIATTLSHFALRKGFSWGGAQVTRLRPTEVGHGDRSQLGGTGRAYVIVFWGDFTPRKINGWNIIMEVKGRSFSFLNGWFVGFMLIFQGVVGIDGSYT